MFHVYVSGPMTGKPALNFPAFHHAAAVLRAKGHKVTNPAEMDAADEGKTMDWPDYLRRDIRALMDCNAIVSLDGWQDSRGARLERHIGPRAGPGHPLP
jgi:hypothetical protein